MDSLNLPETSCSDNDLDAHLELDDELARALDHHSLVTSQLPDDHIQTADEIIEEIDRLMIGEDTEVAETDCDLELCDPQTVAEFRAAYAWKPISGRVILSQHVYFETTLFKISKKE